MQRSGTKADIWEAASYSNNFFRVTGEQRKEKATIHPLLYADDGYFNVDIDDDYS